MDYLIMGVAVYVIIALIVWYIKFFNKQNQKNTRQKAMQPVKCPLCDSNLFVGENIISKVYRPMNVPDQLMPGIPIGTAGYKDLHPSRQVLSRP